MIDAQKIGDVVVHNLEGPLPPVGTIVSGVVDDSHRSGLSRHHTATHLIGAAARKILGTHVWQAGASKYPDRARLDITHHKRISLEVIEKIEAHVNELIIEDYQISTDFYSREEADSKYGDTLYQGGAPKYRNVRVVEIPGIDAQACAGTHVSSTSHVVAVKVLRTERIQDGVERIEFSAGPDAIKASQKERALLEETAEELGVPVDQAPLAAQKFVKEWKELRNRVSSLEKELATFKSSELEGEKIGDVIFYSQDMGETDMGEVQNFVRQITSKDGALVAVGCFQKNRGMVILAKSNSVNQNCGKLLKSALSLVGGSGGGKESYAQGACSPDKILEALNEIKSLIS